ncbi:MAG: hypothetical protein A2219_01965 [Elusimicrobia bacterium RIFOXYA2_FULL_50_26]|nr:MAG: hypothetical protein A2219_01965 [Elusimicrobia bacterium RIFOXYA2_FULL_50_26]OGS24026.1 MAG: hypothetical protein A2314_02585 [Elusimicrobia bacterium RIFOXYB2_FULL_50_12]
MTEIILLSLLAAVISLDVTAFGQFMISRPIVCGPLFGYIMGDIKAGLWLGMIIELFWSGEIPMGAAIPADTTTVTILAIAWSLFSLPGQKSALVLSTALAIPAGILFRQGDILLRSYNVRLVHWVEKGVKEGNESRIAAGVYIGLALFFLKALVFFIFLIMAGQWALPQAHALLPASFISGLELCWKLLPIAGCGMIFLNLRKSKFPCFK